jgi:hypothetical protein
LEKQVGVSNQSHPPLALHTKSAGRTGGRKAISDRIFDLSVSDAGPLNMEHALQAGEKSQ